jgi:hypothetical protein
VKPGSSRSLLLATALVAGGPRLVWAEPNIECRADATGQRAVLRVTVREMFDEELLRLVELGLVGRLRVQATLYRRRRVWFDAKLQEVRRQLSVSWSRANSTFIVEGQAVPNPNVLELPDLVLSSTWDDRLEGGEVYADVSARLEVNTASSLGQVARWLVGSKGAGRSGSTRTEAGGQLVPSALVEYLAADLARTASGRCPLRRSRRTLER